MTCPYCKNQIAPATDSPVDADKAGLQCLHRRVAVLEAWMLKLTAQPRLTMKMPDAFAPPELMDMHNLSPETTVKP